MSESVTGRSGLALKALMVLFSLLLALGSVAHEYQDELSMARAASEDAAARAQLQDTFSPAGQFFDIFDHTTCSYVVWCGPSDVSQDTNGASAESGAWYKNGPVGLVYAAATILPKIPDVLYRLLVARWEDGSIAFLTGMVFVLGYLTVLIVAARSHLWAFIVMVPLGPFAVGAVFWVLKEVIVLLGLAGGLLIGNLLAIAALPGLLIVILMRDLGEVREGFTELARLAKGGDSDTVMTAANTAFGELMRIAARETPDFVRIESDVPALKTRFHADEAAAAAIAAGATVAADIWTLRSGERQRVTVNSREAAAALVSFLHQKFEDKAKAPDPRGQAAASGTAAHGFCRTRDGRFVYLHPSFPESTRRLLKVLDCPDTKDDVSATMLRWDALEFENAVAAAGACAGLARTPEEWDGSEQGRVLAARPVVEIVKIGESAPEPFAAGGDAPLSGVRVLDLTRVLAGPTCARTLAQYGADAMVISSPNLPSVPYFVTDTGHGKRAAFVDLQTDHGRAALRELVRTGDVFSQGYRQGALERRGFGPIELAMLRPGIIVTAINCYGHEGPWRERPGWEQLGQTVTGMAVMHGGEKTPELLPGAVTDYSTGFLAAFGTMVALQRRALYGGSYLVRVSLAQTAMWVRGLGLADETRLTGGRALSADEIAGWSVRSETGFGGLSHLRPSVTMSATPTRWRRGVVPLGTDAAEWAAR